MFAIAGWFRNGVLSALVALFAFAMPARAEVYANDIAGSTDPNRDLIVAAAMKLADIAKGFGCHFAWGNMNDPSSVQLEYVPAGDDVRNWTRLVTITTVGMSTDDAAQRKLLEKLQTIMSASFAKSGKVIESKSGTDKNGLPTLFVEYETGAGAAKEHNAAGILRVLPQVAAVVQIQSRGKPLARTDADKMKTLASIKTQN